MVIVCVRAQCSILSSVYKEVCIVCTALSISRHITFVCTHTQLKRIQANFFLFHRRQTVAGALHSSYVTTQGIRSTVVYRSSYEAGLLYYTAHKHISKQHTTQKTDTTKIVSNLFGHSTHK